MYAHSATCVRYYQTVDRQTEVRSISYNRCQCVNNLPTIEPDVLSLRNYAPDRQTDIKFLYLVVFL